MKVILNTDNLTIAQLYALSWMVIDQPDVYKVILKEHNQRDKMEREMRKQAQFIEENPDAFE